MVGVTAIRFEPDPSGPVVAEIGGALRGDVRLVLSGFLKDVAVHAAVTGRWTIRWREGTGGRQASRIVTALEHTVIAGVPLFKGESVLPLAFPIPDGLPIPQTLRQKPLEQHQQQDPAKRPSSSSAASIESSSTTAAAPAGSSSPASKKKKKPAVTVLSASCDYVLKLTASWPSGSILGGRAQKSVDVPFVLLPSSRQRSLVLARRSPLAVSNIWTEIAPGTSCPTPTALSLAHLFSTSSSSSSSSSSSTKTADPADPAQTSALSSPFGGPMGEWDPYRLQPPSTPIDRGDVRYELQLQRRTFLLGDSIPVRLIMRARSTPLGVEKRLAAVVITVIGMHSYRLPSVTLRGGATKIPTRRAVTALVSKRYTLGNLAAVSALAAFDPTGGASLSSEPTEPSEAGASSDAASVQDPDDVSAGAVSPAPRRTRVLAASGGLTALAAAAAPGSSSSGVAVSRTFKVPTPMGEDIAPSMGANGLVEVRYLLRISVYVEGGPGGGVTATGGTLASSLNEPVGRPTHVPAPAQPSAGATASSATGATPTGPASPLVATSASAYALSRASSSPLASTSSSAPGTNPKSIPPAPSGGAANATGPAAGSTAAAAAAEGTDPEAVAATEAAVKDVIQANELNVMRVEPSLVIEVPVTLLGRGAGANPMAVPYVPRGYADPVPGVAATATVVATPPAAPSVVVANGARPTKDIIAADDGWEVQSSGGMTASGGSSSSATALGLKRMSSASSLLEAEAEIEGAGIADMIVEEGEMEEDDPARLETGRDAKEAAAAAAAAAAAYAAAAAHRRRLLQRQGSLPEPPGAAVPTTSNGEGRLSSADEAAVSEPEGSDEAAGRYVALYPFWSEDPNEITLSIGDRVTVTTAYADGWAFAMNETKGTTGFCPLHYLCAEDDRRNGGGGGLGGGADGELLRMSDAINTSISQKVEPTSDWRRLCHHEPRFRAIYHLMTSHKPDVGSIHLPPAARVSGNPKRMSSAWAEQERCPHCYNQAAPNVWQ